MIRQTLNNIIFDFFLHIEINTLNRPYTSLPKPYTNNALSRLVRSLFEKDWIRRIFGANLVTAMLIIPLSTQLQSAPTTEPPTVITRTDMVSSYLPDDTSILTKPREYIIPVENLKYITQKFHRGHYGYDLNSNEGSTVKAFSHGQVYTVEDGVLGYGRHIIIDHGHGLFSLYAHLQKFDVAPGDIVKAGQKIGEVGMTGYTTGPHLHFEIHDNNTPVDPQEYLDI